MENHDSIISYLLEKDVLSEETVRHIEQQVDESGKSAATILREGEYLDEDQLTEVVASANGIEFVNLAADMIDPIIAHMIPYEMASQHNVIPIRKEEKKLVVAMSSPLNLIVRDEIEVRTGYRVIPVAATAAAIRQAVTYHFSVRDVTKQAIVSMRLKQESGSDEARDIDEMIEGELSGQASEQNTNDPITKLVSSIIGGAIDARASDIHLEPQTTELRVRYRVDGVLRNVISVPLSAQSEIISHVKITSNMDISEKRLPQDGHMAVKRSGKGYDLRVSALPSVSGEKIVIRILDKNVERWSLENVVSRKDDNQIFRDVIRNPYGMILMTGPTGSGKTTTLYALLQLLNEPERNIVTIENPVEYRLEGITQVQVNEAAGLTFAPALRSILRQDPDVILIGEIRDYETAEIAVSAALTGHLVLSTLHTNDAVGAISRLMNLGVQGFLVSSSLLCSVAQRLIRTVCSCCREPYEASDEEMALLFGGVDMPEEKLTLYRGRGCSRCYDTGYMGRKAVYEIMRITPKIEEMIVGRRSEAAINKVAQDGGMRMLYDNLLREVKEGITTVEEMKRIIEMRVS